MGIGFAFASGLVKGFTQNIQQEKARRLAENEKVDALQQLVFAASLDPKKKVSQGAKDLLKSARQQLDDRPSIGLFGRATDGIDLDFAKLQSTLNDTDEFGVTFGTGENLIGFASDISKGIDAKLGRAYLSEVSGFANSSDYATRLDKLTNQEFVNLYSSMGAARGALVQAAAAGQNEYKLDVAGAEDSDMFRGLYKLDDYYDNRFKSGPPPSTTNTGMNIGRIEQVVMPIAEDHKNNTGVMPDTIGMPTSTSSPDIITYTNKSDKEALQMIADGLGIDPITAYAYWQTGFMDIPDIDPEDQRQAFDTSVYLGANVTNVANLDPDESLYMLPEQAIKGIVKKAKASGATDLQAFAYALAPYMQGPKKPSEPRTWGTRRKQRQERIQDYILRRVYGENKSDQISFKDFKDAQTALESTFTRITELETEIKGLDAPAAYDAFKGRLYAIFDPEEGLFGGMLKDLGISPTEGDGLNVNDKENLTAEYGKYLNAKVEAASKTGGVNAAKLEAMRISLAFEMARAADPSGRLSNQDIEQQLRKLGTPFQTVNQALAAIVVAKKEFSTKAEQYKVLVRLGESQKMATERDYQIIDGTIAADYLLRNSTVPTASTKQATPVDISNIVKTPSGKIINQATGLPATAAEIEAFKNQGTQL